MEEYMRRIWFRTHAEDKREEYDAMISFFSQNLLDELSLMTEKEWEEIVIQLWEVLYWNKE